MTKYLSGMFRQIREQVQADYSTPNWEAGKRWLRRVGFPRLYAEHVASEASNLLDGISLSIHRNEPELDALLRRAREAAGEYALAVGRSNWERFDR